MSQNQQHIQPVRDSSFKGLMEKVSSFGRRIITPVWPVCCPLCDKPLYREEGIICLDCLSKIPRILVDAQLPYLGVPGNVVVERSWFVYDREDPSHELIRHIKYHDRYRLARKLGREFAMQKLGDGVQIDVLLPIPLHWSKYIKRGYNQSYRIALGIKDVLGIKIGRNLCAIRPHLSQTMCDGESRNENVRGIFAIKKPSELDGRHIALVDDVITTGATMFSALDTVLESCTPASVMFLSLARGKQL